MRGLKDSIPGELLMDPRRAIEGAREIQKIAQYERAMFGENALRVKLHAIGRQRAMRDAHDHAVIRLRGDFEIDRRARALNDEGMVARRLERSVDAAKHAA